MPPSDKHLEVLRNLSSDLLNAIDLESVLRTIARSTLTTLDYEDCVIYLVDDDRQSLTQKAAFGPKSPDGLTLENPMTLRMGEGVVGTAAQQGKPILVTDTHDTPFYVVDDDVRRSELAVPVVESGEVIGVIDSEHSEPGFYTGDDLQALMDIASIASARLRSANAMVKLRDSIAELEKTKRELDRLVVTDHLTRLNNRRGFEQAIARFSQQREAALALVDLDRFKQINDTLGHAAGDHVLKQTGLIIEQTAPSSHCVASRLGGDEFGLLCESDDIMQQWATAIVERIRTSQWNHHEALLSVTASLGYASLDHGPDIWGLADEALFIAKQQGGDQAVAYDVSHDLMLRLETDRQWIVKLRAALASDELLLFGQPIVYTQAPDTVAYFEVLLRYREECGNIVGPAPIIEAAERFGHQVEIDKWVLRKVMLWLATQPDDVRVSVNVSACYLDWHQAVGYIERLLERYGTNPQRICLEITETVAIADIQQSAQVISALKTLGFKVAVDDFGKGWSSLPLVRDVDVDVVKIDGEWIRQLATDALSEVVVQAIADTASLIGVEIVAEWVEDIPTYKKLTDMGIDYLQGFLTGKPRPLAECGVDVELDPSWLESARRIELLDTRRAG